MLCMAIKLTKLTEQGKMETSVIEQRKDARSDLAWPVSVWLPEANRFFNGKSINISKSGYKFGLRLRIAELAVNGHTVPKALPPRARLLCTRNLSTTYCSLPASNKKLTSLRGDTVNGPVLKARFLKELALLAYVERVISV